ncbi:unnamed protein product [Paramecium pentaurelia]|uniref:ABC transporter domain-containing protein n=1 Tax=Paramecium pentaurelia TaxID=43138 RepID=A0A8S1V923_9CILI|nr:unnamed protein product [Paramecium pentaurelia]
MQSQDEYISLPKVKPNKFDNQEIDLVWKNLSVTITTKAQSNKPKVTDPLLSYNNEKIILNDVSGYAKAGQMTAIMGPSGAGKTTLVALLSKRYKPGPNTYINGEILANNSKYKRFNDFGAFVIQDDLLMATLTVKETLMFAANMRLKDNLAQRMSRVDQIIKDLNLRSCQNTLVGDNIIKGISGGEKKRTSIGMELISDPQVLILDEPTSGLDSFTAFICMNILKKITINQKRTVIFTIHQPSIDICQLFDRMIILNNGQTIYQGNYDFLLDYCLKVNLNVDIHSTPLDSIMNNLNDAFNQGDNKVTHENYKLYLEKDTQKFYSQNQGYNKRKTQTSFCQEMKYLMQRQFTNYVRSPNLLRSKIFGSVFMLLFLGELNWMVGKDQPPQDENVSIGDLSKYLNNMRGACFVCGTSAIFSALGPLLMLFPIERNIFLKEENSKMYRVSSYFLSKVFLEVPMNVFIQILFSIALYAAFGFIWQLENLILFTVISVSVSLSGNGLGIFTGCLFKDAKQSASLGPILLIPLQVFSGQYANLASIPKFISWVQYISPFKYFLEGFGRTQLNDATFHLDPTGVEISPWDYYGMHFGMWNCVIVLISIAVMFHVFAGIFLKLLVNKLNV